MNLALKTVFLFVTLLPDWGQKFPRLLDCTAVFEVDIFD